MTDSRPATAAIAIVGAGAVAQAIGRFLASDGRVVALASRSRGHAERAARFVGPGVRVVEIRELPGLATRILIAVRDEAIAQVAVELASAGMTSGVALHTCGGKSPVVLAPLGRAGVACGVAHPLQTFVTGEQGVERLRGVTFGASGDPQAVEWAREIAGLVGGRALIIEADRLPAYHAGAVMASNAIVGVLDAAVLLMERAGVDRNAALGALEPIARASVENALTRGPVAALTGPVVRGDATTVAGHLEALSEAPPTVADLYVAAARHLITMARQRGLPESSVRALEATLDGLAVRSEQL